MHPALILLSLLPLVACAGADSPGNEQRANQVSTCAAVIAAHDNISPSTVTARWLRDVEGGAWIEVRDRERRHICDIDTAGNVRSYWKQPL